MPGNLNNKGMTPPRGLLILFFKLNIICRNVEDSAYTYGAGDEKSYAPTLTATNEN